MKYLLYFLILIFISGCSSTQQPTYEQRVLSQEKSKARTAEAERKINEWIKQQKVELNNKEKQEVKTLAEKAKSTCEIFGYKPGTEKFADCAKEIYLKETTPTEKKSSQTIIVKNEDSGAQLLAEELKRQRRQEAFDELLGISQGMLSGKSLLESISGSSGSYSSGSITCFKTGEETGGLNKICRYDCVGNLVTTTVGSAQICPIQIKR
ncbi:hypothetical protein OAP58_00375 [Candidatus Pelagibacter sp.]|nr:hypothetical protein [Candidatus Pelagibacter sp.]